ncbi:MAG: cell division protein FtsB [Ottowia sp.]|nr:cell division protein FtsB [Ottowia sp.]
MRLLILGIGLLLVLIQYPLWLGKGGWLRVWELERQLLVQARENEALRARNMRLAGEVQDLHEGTGAIEERARFELGMVRAGEHFVQLVPPASP